MEFYVGLVPFSTMRGDGGQLQRQTFLLPQSRKNTNYLYRYVRMTGYVELLLLDGGSFIADSTRIHAGVEKEQFRLYNWAFYVHHPSTGHRLLWDMGISSSKSDYSTFVAEQMFDIIGMTGPRVSLRQQIREEVNVSAEGIDSVIFSHAHFDHCRPISSEFPRATAYFGPGTHQACSPGHLEDAKSQWDGRFFDPVRCTEAWEELAGPWQQFATFPLAMDYFGDGSFWIVQAPGHMQGNLCAIGKLKQGEYVVLGSDCCHSKQLYDGVYDFAVFDLPNGETGCLQEDISAARHTLSMIKAFENGFGAHVAFAHDASWILNDTDTVLLSLLTSSMEQNAKMQIRKGEPI